VSGHATRFRLASALTITTIASLAAAVTPTAAHAALAAPTSLAPSGPVSSSTPTLSWRRVVGASTYTVQVDDSAGFASPLFSVTTVNSRAVPTAQLPDGNVYWHVRANSGSTSSPWSTAVLNVSPSAAPGPISPVEGVTLEQPNDPPLLTWSATAGAVGYTVQVATDEAFTTNMTAYKSPGTSFVVPTPATAGDWFWRVQADRGNGLTSDWSDAAHFVVQGLPDVQIDPSMNSGVPMQDVVLDWLPVAGALKYEIVVGLDPDFNNLIEGSKQGTSHRYVYGTRYSPPQTYDNDQYFWEVRAVNTAGTASEWPVAPWIFQREWPERPELVHPADGANVSDAFFYQWSPVNVGDDTVLRHVSEYQLDVGGDPNFSPGTFATCYTASTTYAAGYGTGDPCMPDQGATTYWRVRGRDGQANIQGIYSEVHSFIYASAAVQLLTPTNNATVDVPTLRWAAAIDAATYHVEIFDNTATRVITATTSALSYTPEKELKAADGPFTWRVQAVDADGHESPSELFPSHHFQVSGTPPTTGAPALTPLTGISTDAATVRFPSLSWEPMAGAKTYRIDIGVAGSGFFYADNTSHITGTAYPYSAATDTGTFFLTPGSYDWFVTAYDADGGQLGFGDLGTFTIAPLPDVVGQRIALSGTALDGPNGASCLAALGPVVAEEDICTGVPATPVLDWNPVPGAGLYMVYLANDRALTNRIYTGVITTNSRWTPTSSMTIKALADNTAQDAYYWYIRPCKSTTRCNVDPISTNKVATNAFRKIAPAVELVAPASGAVATAGTNEVTFTWTDYLDTNLDTVYREPLEGEPSTSEALTYRLAVSTSATMSPLVSGFPVTVDQTTFTPFDHTLPEGNLYWRVQAVDAEGNFLNWSETRSFTKHSPKAQLVSPINGVATSGATPFRWTAAPGAATYQLEVYKNADSLFQTANRVFVKTGIKQTAYQWDKYLPTSAQDYLWRVRYLDAKGLPGPWSRDVGDPQVNPNGRFAVHSGTLTLTSPAVGAYQPAAAPYFTWQPVAKAARYLLEARLVGSASMAIRQFTAAQAFAATATLKDGSYEWRVTAQDPNQGTLAQSGWRSFKVDGTAPIVVSRSPVTTAARTANFVAKFNEPVTGVTTVTVKLFVKGRTAPLPASVTLSANKMVATLNPSSNLVAGKVYTLRLKQGIKDRAGNALVPTSWSAKAK